MVSSILFFEHYDPNECLYDSQNICAELIQHDNDTNSRKKSRFSISNFYFAHLLCKLQSILEPHEMGDSAKV